MVIVCQNNYNFFIFSLHSSIFHSASLPPSTKSNVLFMFALFNNACSSFCHRVVVFSNYLFENIAIETNISPVNANKRNISKHNSNWYIYREKYGQLTTFLVDSVVVPFNVIYCSCRCFCCCTGYR